MRDMECLQLMLHSKLPAFKRKVEKAQKIIDEAFIRIEKPYLAFSGGIDSTVLLDLIEKLGYRIPVLFGDDGWDYEETMLFLSAMEWKYGFDLLRIRCLDPWRDWCIKMGRPELTEQGEGMDAAWYNPHKWHATWNSLKDAVMHGYDGVFLGLLAGESRGRRMITHDGHRPIYQVKQEQDMWHCSPLASWTKKDVWAYTINHGLSHNLVYDRLADLDVPLEYRRVGPLTCYRVLQYGSGVKLRQGWPELYNELSSVFPKMREYS